MLATSNGGGRKLGIMIDEWAFKCAKTNIQNELSFRQFRSNFVVCFKSLKKIKIKNHPVYYELGYMEINND